MKRESRQMGLIYFLIFVIIVSIVLLTKVIMDSVKKEKPVKKKEKVTEKVEVSPYPNVNEECVFNVATPEYQSLTSAGCENGYTRYNLNDITINDKSLKVSIVYSDKNQAKTGLFVNDKLVKAGVDSIANFNFGVFDNKLFVLDKTGEEVNVLAFSDAGKKIYDLKKVLEKEEIKDLSTGDTVISSKTLNPNTFIFKDGVIEFDSVSEKCEGSNKSKGSHYKILYVNEKFEKPEFIELINC